MFSLGVVSSWCLKCESAFNHQGWSLHYDCEIFAKVCLILPQHDVDGGHEAGPLLVGDGEDAGVEAGAHQPHPGLDQPQRRHLVPRPRAGERHSSQVPVNTAMEAVNVDTGLFLGQN